MKTVSVIVPTHNRAHLICEAIDSILKQDIADCELEIIVVDDGSTDNTRDVLQIYGDKIRYIFQENQGAGVARNRGIEEAWGEWISFLDSDDRWLPYKLSLQFRVLEEYPSIKIIHSNFYSFEESEIIIPKGLEYWVKTIRNVNKINWSDTYSNRYDSLIYNISQNGKSFDIYAGNIFSALLHACYGSCWTMLIHRSCLKKHIRFAENFPTWEDYWFLCLLAEYNDIVFMDIDTAENRGHRGERLTTRPDFIDPLICHLAICQDIFMKSRSPYRPSDAEIVSKCKDIQLRLIKEYLKKGNLTEAKNARDAVHDMVGIQDGLTVLIYRLLTHLPFNVISHLVRMKRRLNGR